MVERIFELNPQFVCIFTIFVCFEFFTALIQKIEKPSLFIFEYTLTLGLLFVIFAGRYPLFRK